MQFLRGRIHVGESTAPSGSPRHPNDGCDRCLIRKMRGPHIQQLRSEAARDASHHGLLVLVGNLMESLLQHDGLVVHLRSDRGGRVGLAGFCHHVHQGVPGHGKQQLAHAQQRHVRPLLRRQVSAHKEVVPGEHSDHRRDSLGADERLLKLEGVLHQRPGAWHEQAVANFQVVERLTRRRREKEVFPNLRRSPLARVVVETLLTQPVDGVRVRRD